MAAKYELAEPAGPAREKAFEEALDALRDRRDEFAAQGHVPRDFLQLLKRAGIYRASTPQRFGGEPMAPTDFLDRIERISAVDPATGWVASFGSSLTYLTALPLEVQEQLYAQGPDIVYAGALFPMHEPEVIEGGFRCTGRWQFASGSAGADILGVGLKDPTDPRPRNAIIDPADAEVIENWDVAGMRATGSNDIKLDGVFVPHERTFIRGGASTVDEPLYHYPALAYAAQVLAVTGVGAARGALDYVREVGSQRTSITGGNRRGTTGTFQIGVARAEARLRSARAWFYEATDEVWQTVLAGDEVSYEQKVLLRLATSHAAHESRAVVMAAFDLAGTGAIYTKHPLQRFVQDALVPPQHAMLAGGTYEASGAMLLGAEAGIPSFP
ncbi:acyl-CoA dehydrogenase family protein [Janibacter terrae]|uniref:acyl-CoA dehydrogenase family protein n=1 Tax=Janibacter terrae TaxID=103817 RepID=UPI0031F7A4E0